MLVNITANIVKNSPLASNQPAPDWPIDLRISDDQRQTILECHGELKAAELQAVLLTSGASADDNAIPQFLKNLMGKKTAEIERLNIPEAAIQQLRDLIRIDDFISENSRLR